MEIAISPAIAGGSPEPAISEPISPELVLVDPELRRALQAEALERAPLRLIVSPEPPRPAEAPDRAAVALSESPTQAQTTALPSPASLPRLEAEPRRARRGLAAPRRYLVRAILPISLVLNAILITLAVSDASVSPDPSAARPSLSLAAPGNNEQTPSPAAKAKRQSTQTRGATAVAARKPTAPRLGARDPRLERRLLNLIIQAPAGKLPRELIDSKTGLAKNNLHAVCRREAGRGSFLCFIQPARHKPGEGLYARYRLNGKGNSGTFTWYRYRTGR
jgi:hypothetical protein